MPDVPNGLKKNFPYLTNQNWERTSCPDEAYNCIAWAYGANNKWFWPDEEGTFFANGKQSHWPAGVPREENIDAFKALFNSIGYVSCQDGSVEQGFEKVVLYADGEEPTHAARQLKGGKWTSKIGHDMDIQHDDPYCLCGPLYGNVAVFMKRQKRTD
jgi:hypothetical protein